MSFYRKYSFYFASVEVTFMLFLFKIRKKSINQEEQEDTQKCFNYLR